MKTMTRAFVVVLCVLCFAFAPAGVKAALLTLSTHSSNGFAPYTLPEYLDATLDFTVVDNKLTLIVTNTTDGNPADYQFDIVEVYFNYNNTVTGLTWDGAATNGWALHDNPDNFHVDGFGYFDVRLYIDPPPNKSIGPGDFETFNLIFGGIGSAEDFTTFLSVENGGDILGLAVANFDSGGPDGIAWAYGMVIPEPATIGLLGLGGLFLLIRRKRRA